MKGPKTVLAEVKRAQIALDLPDVRGELFGTKRCQLIGVVFGLCWALSAPGGSPVDRILSGSKSQTAKRKRGARK